jgi:hypothetical protein
MARPRSGGVASWRVVLGIAVLTALVAFTALLSGPYYRNWKLQRYLEETAFSAEAKSSSGDLVGAAVADQAARLGLPVRTEQIRVTRSDGGLYIEARYFVRVDLLLYTVDLHFRPSAGVR